MQSEIDQNMEQRIVLAAEQLFLRQGFAGTSTTEIARQVGCNQALVHYYFRTKEKLFQAIYQKNIGTLFESLFHAVDPSLPFLERLGIRMSLHFDFLCAHQELPSFFLNELARNPQRIQMIKELLVTLPVDYFQQFANELQADIEAGRIRPIEPLDLAFTALSLNVMVFISAPLTKTLLKENTPESFQKFIEHRRDENIRTVMALLRPEPGAQR